MWAQLLSGGRVGAEAGGGVWRPEEFVTVAGEVVPPRLA